MGKSCKKTLGLTDVKPRVKLMHANGYLVRTKGVLLAAGAPVLPTALQLISNVEGEQRPMVSISRLR